MTAQNDQLLHLIRVLIELRLDPSMQIGDFEGRLCSAVTRTPSEERVRNWMMDDSDSVETPVSAPQLATESLPSAGVRGMVVSVFQLFRSVSSSLLLLIESRVRVGLGKWLPRVRVPLLFFSRDRTGLRPVLY